MIFRCASDARRQAVRAAAPGLNGIDYVEVGVGNAEVTRRTLLVVLVNELQGGPPPPSAWQLEGGQRYTGLRVTASAATDDARTVRLTCDLIGDLSWYTLRLVGVSDPFPVPPEGWDPALAEVRFAFRPGCGADLDCRPPAPEGRAPLPPPPIDYTAKDYDAFRRVALDHLARLQPGWQQAEVADVRTMLTEVLAAEADRLSYLQDAIDTEGLFGRARQRISMRRLARLVDYAMHDGCSARVFVRFSVDADVAAPGPGSRLVASSEEGPPVIRAHSQDEARARERGALVFEVVEAPPTLYAALSGPMRFHTWSGTACVLPRSACRATLAGAYPQLGVGDLVLLSSTAPDGDAPDSANPELRHVVRIARAQVTSDPATGEPVTEVSWHPDDALPFELPVTAVFDRAGTDGTFGTAQTDGTNADESDPWAIGDRDIESLGVAARVTASTAAVFGNVVVADHGETVRDSAGLVASIQLPDPHPEPTDDARPDSAPSESQVHDESSPEVALGGRPAAYRPALPVTGLAQRAPHTPYDRSAGGPVMSAVTARAAQIWDARDVRPAVELDGAEGPWTVHRDLLALDAADRGVVVEVDDDGVPLLRFGNNDNGRAPASGADLRATVTVGVGSIGNLDTDAVNRLLVDGPSAADLADAVRLVSNPLPAFGGLDPEPLERVRNRAPATRLESLRCVTADDYAARAARFAGVERAFARIEWTGSWETVVVYADRVGGAPVDPEFEAALVGYLETFRLMGHDVEVADPVWVPLELTVRVCPVRGAYWPSVRAAVGELLSNRVSPQGIPGLFHPDRMTFGSPVDTGPITAAVQALPGVSWVEVTDVRTLGLPSPIAVQNGRLALVPPQIARLDNDPQFPDRGTVHIEQVTA